MLRLPTHFIEIFPKQRSFPKPGQSEIWVLDISEFSLSNYADELRHTLSEAEQKKLAFYKTDLDKRQYAASRLLLRCLLSAYFPNQSPKSWLIEKQRQGKPFVLNAPVSIAFSISHSHEKIAIGFCENDQFGIDVEHCREDVNFQRIAQLFFSDSEAKQFEKLSHSEQQDYFYQLWTVKEAIMKATGQGFALSMKSIQTIGIPPRFIAVEGQPYQWQFDSIEMGDYRLAVVSVGANNLKTELLSLSSMAWIAPLIPNNP